MHTDSINVNREIIDQIPSMRSIERKAIITGASRGIGRACALNLAKEGWQLALFCHKHQEEAEQLADQCRQLGVMARVYTADNAVAEELADALGCALKDFQGFDALISNAGIAEQKLFTEIERADWERMLSVNLTAAYQFTRALIPGMIRRRFGRIVFVSSIWGRVGASMEAHYAAAKGGLIALGKSLAKELGPSEITVNTVCPGVIATAMNDGLDDDALKELVERTPLGRLGRPEDVAALIAFLLSDQAAFITCQTIGVDGGFGL